MTVREARAFQEAVDRVDPDPPAWYAALWIFLVELAALIGKAFGQ